METEKLIVRLKALAGRASFCGITYTAKKTGELARYSLLLNANYRKVCAADLLELEIQARNAQGIRRFAIRKLIDSLKESIRAMDEGDYHYDNRKAGLYVSITPAIKVFVDGTLEIQGLERSRVVIEPGEYRKVNSSPLVALKNEIRRGLKVGKVRTLCVDAGHLHSVRLNGKRLEFY